MADWIVFQPLLQNRKQTLLLSNIEDINKTFSDAGVIFCITQVGTIGIRVYDSLMTNLGLHAACGLRTPVATNKLWVVVDLYSGIFIIKKFA